MPYGVFTPLCRHPFMWYPCILRGGAIWMTILVFIGLARLMEYSRLFATILLCGTLASLGGAQSGWQYWLLFPVCKECSLSFVNTKNSLSYLYFEIFIISSLSLCPGVTVVFFFVLDGVPLPPLFALFLQIFVIIGVAFCARVWMLPLLSTTCILHLVN